MKGIKDFFHDSNDILLAVIIILLAIGVIGWRIMVILDYPDKVAAEQAKTEQTQVEEQTASEDSSSEADTDADADADAESSSDDTASEDESSSENAVG